MTLAEPTATSAEPAWGPGVDGRFFFRLPAVITVVRCVRHACRRCRAEGVVSGLGYGPDRAATAVCFRRPGDSMFRPHTVEVMRIEGGMVAEIIDFSSPGVFGAFRLPPVL